MVEDVRSLLREFAGRKPQPTAMVVDSRTVQSTPESGARPDTRRQATQGIEGTCGGRYPGPSARLTRDCGQRAGPRAQVERLAEEVQQITGHSVELAYVDQVYNG
jgi:hypothetical protein